MTPERATCVVNEAVASMFSGAETDPAVFEYAITTLPHAATIASRRAGVNPSVLLGVMAAEADVTAARIGRPLPASSLNIPPGISVTRVLSEFGHVAAQIRESYERTGAWDEALADHVLRTRVRQYNGAPATAAQTAVFIESATKYLRFYDALLTSERTERH